MDFSSNSSNLFLSKNLRALRKRLGCSQEELADKIGLNRGNIASYESGSAEPKICNLVKFARFFKVSIFDLTHSDLKDENSYTSATQRHLNGGAQPIFPSIKQYAEEAKEFEGAIKGMECFFNMKLRQMGDIPEELAFFKQQYEQLNALSQHLIHSHIALIEAVKNKCEEASGENDIEQKAKSIKA